MQTSSSLGQHHNFGMGTQRRTLSPGDYERMTCKEVSLDLQEQPSLLPVYYPS